MTLLKYAVLLALGMVADPGLVRTEPASPPRAFDWCAPVVVDPLRRWSESNTCFQPYGFDEIAASAEVVVLEGFELPDSDPDDDTALADPCGKKLSLASHARYLRELRARAAGRPQPPIVTQKTRFDLVGPLLAAHKDFDAGFLLRTDRPWSDVLRFFSGDRSPDCAKGGCRLVEPEELFALVDARAKPGTSRSLVYYLSRGSDGQRVYRVTNGVADLSNPAYRAWRVAEARRVLEKGGYDAVMLNQKFHQHRPAPSTPVGHWVGGPTSPDVTALNRLGNTLWTAPPRGYGYPEYVAGWHALAGDLRRAGVPYAVMLTPAPWLSPRHDDPTSPLDENALIREAARGARLVLLDQRAARRGREFAAVKAELEKAGARVVAMDGSCGQPGARIGGSRPRPIPVRSDPL